MLICTQGIFIDKTRTEPLPLPPYPPHHALLISESRHVSAVGVNGFGGNKPCSSNSRTLSLLTPWTRSSAES